MAAGSLSGGIFCRRERRLRALHFLDGHVERGVVARALLEHLPRLIQRLLLGVAHDDDVVRVITCGIDRRLRDGQARKRPDNFLRGQRRDNNRRSENKHAMRCFHCIDWLVDACLSRCNFKWR